jgi:hypothetical protein
MSSESLDERIARVQRTLHRRSSLTETMRKTIAYCAERRAFADAERIMATYPEFRYIDQSQAAVIGILVNAGAIEQFELDAAGSVIPEARLRAMTEDERDDAVCAFALQSTQAGIRAIEGMEPEARLAHMFAEHPERRDAYCKILSLCRTPRTFEEVSGLLDPNPAFASENDLSTLPVYPSALLAKVEAAGGIVWDEAWVTTEAGAACLR